MVNQTRLPEYASSEITNITGLAAKLYTNIQNMHVQKLEQYKHKYTTTTKKHN